MLNKIYFDNFVRLNRGFDLPDNRMQEGEFPVVASTNIKGYHNEYKIEPPVVVTGRSGSLGNVQYITDKCWPLNTTLYSKDFRGNNPHYIYYYLQTMHLEQYNAGAGVPTLNQNHLQRLKVLVHPIDEQDKIAFILSTYDSLIEVNNKRIKLLEQMAEELYKEWFVRFRFPGYETAEFENGLPKGWKVKKVKELVKRLPFGTLYKSEDAEENGNVIIIDQSLDEFVGFHNNAPSHIANIENPIVIFGDHSCKHQLMITPFSLSENVVPYVANDEVRTTYLYYLTHGIVETTEYKRHWSEFVAKKVLVAPINIQDRFVDNVNSNIMFIQRLKNQNRNLIKQRDLLLPRLMSGKLEV